ncbi:unnamed protein product [Urochloa humidicola]
MWRRAPVIEHPVMMALGAFQAASSIIKMGNKGTFVRFRAPEMKLDIVTFSGVVAGNEEVLATAMEVVNGTINLFFFVSTR